ncbi:MAG: hypothetical protein VZR53_05590 [Prevotella sp.]|nr:hypothetical protein [Prevotella sp.]
MKATELMKGDWVSYIGKDFNDYIDRVSEIIDGCVVLDKEMIHRSIDNIHPIPLTPEILEKNGFEQHITAPCGYYHAPVFDMYDVLFHASKDSYEDTWHVEVFTDHNDNNYVLFNICYTHELQHVLRLCGLNALADNLKLEE